ncbi:hypothetical protein [Thermoclostridium caenicola]|uniref:Uncharacterized protein n=1 Tax=Thermoclostridium caenicola TaxID=659425 RepID=A0A1M6GZN8_9FIRM|nr:hypothetical protein [Thermoclostridium caenicola]SHJ15437.1 hypothetical protein SAMN05444373_10288 [Thermoclostridium caenicola]
MRFIKSAMVFAMLLCLVFSGQAAVVSEAAGEEAEGYISGVVREVNPSLGYITLYRWDGSGMSPEAQDNLTRFRTYSFAYSIPVTRDEHQAALEDVQPGDYAFIQLDEEGYVAWLSTRSYYKPIYGTIYRVNLASPVLKQDDGIYRSISVAVNVPIYQNDQLIARNQIQEGDRVRILAQIDGTNVHVQGIELLKDPKPVSAIYRGNVEYYDELNNTLALSGVQEFVNGRWEYSSFIGVRSFPYSRDYKDRPSGRISGMAYIAVQEDINGEDSIVMAAFRSKPQNEMVFTDNVLALSNTLNRLELQNTSQVIGFDAGTIAVKNGRLVDMGSLNTMDNVQLSADKPIGSSILVSQVVVSNTSKGMGSLAIYRGRIKTVDPLRSFTVESFAELSGSKWLFSNTPKTFGIDLSTTRLLENSGTGNMLTFDENFVTQSVYIVEDTGKTLLVSTAPYADVQERGRVMSLTDNGFRLREAMMYNSSKRVWTSAPNRDVNVPANAIIIKDGKTADLSAIRPGDSVRIVSNNANRDGIIIIVES